MERQNPTQMMQSSLARRVRKRLEIRHPQPIHAANVNHPSRLAALARLLQQRRQQLRDGKHPLQVERQDAAPRRIRVLLVRRAPVAARVVDQHVQLLLAPAQLGRQLLAVGLLVEVGRDGVGLALAQRVELPAGGLAGGGVARRYVHDGAVLHEAFADHTADALCAPCDEDDFILE